MIKLIKIPGYPSASDLDRWSKRFEAGEPGPDELEREGITVEVLPDNLGCTLVKVGNDEHKPSMTDLEAWRQIFSEAQNDPDFKIFTHDAVTIETIKLDPELIIISGDAVVVKR